MPKVSVLVAVYNARPFLADCLDSLLGQSLRDIQIICIDDASTDGSLQMLNEYALRDLRVEVIHLPENSGQAHARNAGLQLVKGEVVTMVDADDWLAADALEQVYAAFDATTDAVLFDLRRVYADGHEEPYEAEPFDVLTGREAFVRSLTWRVHGLYAVRSAIHRRYTYDETCRAYSDDNTTRLHFLASRQVRSSAGVYYYRQHADSVTHRPDVRRFDYLRANESMRWQLLELGVDRSLLDLYENQRWLNLVDVYMFYHVHGQQLTAAERRYGRDELYRVWATVDRRALKRETTAKFGYRPCSSWRLFRLQEWIYFTLRGWLGRNR